MGIQAKAALAALLCVAAGGCGDEARQEQAQANGQAAAAGPTEAVERGRYLVRIMDCAGCHNTGAFGPEPESGFLEGANAGFELPGMGVFYPPNLTPHPEAGIGRWTEAQIVTALRTGVRPDGRRLAPIMPWPNYAGLTDEDAQAVAALLKSLPPSGHRAPPPATVETATAPYLTMRVPGRAPAR